MSFKINRNKLETYSQELTEKISDEFFKAKNRINGDEIRNLTAIPQINVFILFNLFERWKEETEKLKSPFFDYDCPAVSTALSNFLNILSNNISISREAFKPILFKSILETLTWVFFPDDYILAQYNSGKLNNLSKIKDYIKYVKINSILITELVAKLDREKKQVFSPEELLFYFSQVHLFNKTYIEDPATVLEQFSEIADFDINELLPPSQQKRKQIVPQGKEENNKEVVVEYITELKIYTPEDVEEIPEISDDDIFFEEVAYAEIPKVEVKEPVKEIVEQKILNHGFTKSQLTLNDKLMQSDNSLNKKLSKSKLNDVRAAITLNKRFEFIRMYF